MTELVKHPNLDEITGIVGQIPLLGVDDLYLLGEVWTNTAEVASARDRALDPECPLVVDVLRTFESITTTFRDTLADAEHPDAANDGLKALRDAVAGAFARPTLSRREYKVLLRPWRTAFPVPRLDVGDLGIITPYF
ncbi:MAG: hypothetical protein GEV07_16545 [Streptosporangiales bacterium]|nr:hypothetical protein [Streptosporangiales bacterium]